MLYNVMGFQVMGKSEHHLLVSLLFAATTVCEVIPRDLIFSSPEYSEVSLSPDGNTVGYLAHDKNGIRNFYTKCVTCSESRLITSEKTDIIGVIFKLISSEPLMSA